VTPEETGKLLGVCASYDNRNVDEMSVYAWYRALGDLPYDSCEAAVVAHYTKSRDWIMPADVRRPVQRELDREVEQERLRTLLDPVAYRKSIEAADAAFLRKIEARTGRQLRAIDE
jgi:hypothetical protein